MVEPDWIAIVQTKNFWAGVAGSMVAGVLAAIIALVWRNSLKIATENFRRNSEINSIYDMALHEGSPFAPFAFGVVQARALRLFLLAVFVAYIGDIMSIFWPANIAIYCLSLILIFFALKWFYKLERRGAAILRDVADHR